MASFAAAVVAFSVCMAFIAFMAFVAMAGDERPGEWRHTEP
jgi:hypothetical protein